MPHDGSKNDKKNINNVDVTDFRILFQQRFNVNGTVFDWFASYFADQTQVVVIDDDPWSWVNVLVLVLLYCFLHSLISIFGSAFQFVPEECIEVADVGDEVHVQYTVSVLMDDEVHVQYSISVLMGDDWWSSCAVHSKCLYGWWISRTVHNSNIE